MKLSEELRLASEIIKNMAEGTQLVGLDDGIIRYCNPKLEEMFGYGHGELLGQHVSIINASTYEDPNESARRIMDILNETGEWHGEFHNVKKDGTTFWCYTHCSTFQHPVHGRVIVCVHTDITERKKSEEKYRMLVEKMNEGLGLVDTNGVITFINDSFARMLERSPEEIIDHPIFEFLNEENRRIFKEQFATRKSGGTNPYELTWETKTGQIATALTPSSLTDDRGNFIGGFALITDITERKKAEEELAKYRNHLEDLVKEKSLQLIQAERMSTLGTFTAGIAHELNNPMMGVLNFVEYCLKHTDKIDKRHEVLEDAKRETNRCIKIIKNFLTFSRNEKDQSEIPRQQQIATILDRVLSLLAFRIKDDGVLIKTNYAKELPQLLLKEGGVQQVFLNILNNALDAVKGRPRKEITLDTKFNSESLEVTISDTGCGISPKNIDKVFDPFFTTKPVGEGTGLGLSISQGIIKDHGGTITCKSELGEGSQFKVVLPVKNIKGELNGE